MGDGERDLVRCSSRENEAQIARPLAAAAEHDPGDGRVVLIGIPQRRPGTAQCERLDSGYTALNKRLRACDDPA